MNTQIKSIKGKVGLLKLVEELGTFRIHYIISQPGGNKKCTVTAQ
jgi:hypothetical protein